MPYLILYISSYCRSTLLLMLHNQQINIFYRLVFLALRKRVVSISVLFFCVNAGSCSARIVPVTSHGS